MLKKIKNLLIKNWKWKLLSLLLACLAWVVFMNIQDPVVTETISNVRVTVVNYDEYIANGNTIELSEMSLDIENLSVDVRVKARQSVMDELLEDYADAIYVWIDPYELEDDDDRLSIHYEIADSYSYKYRNVSFTTLYNQAYYTVSTDSITSVSIPLTYTLVGTPETGYGYLENDEDIVLSPSEITLTGLSEELEEFASASITANVSGLKDNTAQSESISFYDSDGNLVYLPDSVIASATTAVLYVPIYQTKEVDIEVSISGDPAEGYVCDENLILSSETVVICGQESDIEDVVSLTLPVIDIDGASEDVTRTYTVQDVLDASYLDEELLFYSGESEITVTCTVEALETMEVTVNTSEIEIEDLDEEETLVYDDASVTVELTGTLDALEAYDTTELVLTLDASSLTTSSSSASVTVDTGSEDVSAVDETLTVSISVYD